MLFGVCLRYARHHAEAEDFLQDGLLVIYRDIHQYRPIGPLGGWLRRVMINVCLQHIRRRHRFVPTISLDQYGDRTESDEDLFSRFRTKALLRMVQQLPPGYRMVFNLYVIEGFAHQEIAEMLEISVNTSKSQLSRAKASLRNMLERELAEEP